MAVTRADHGMNTLSIRRATVQVEGEGAAGASVRLEEPTPVVVGTAAECALRLTDETASRRHCRMALVDQGVVVTDETSRNGTWIGGVRVSAVLLTSDMRIRVGSTTLLVTLDAETSELALSEASSFGAAHGVSKLMRHVFGRLERASESDVTILLEGESGVGKEILARAIHERSPRAAGPFVTVDCGAISPHVFESELFGHERGAFTGAVSARKGLFHEAHGGTLFLDEIGELPLELQPKLLRLLEAREVRSVGSDTSRGSDVRVVAATNRTLLAEVQRGTFRRDLYYRLAVARAHVPSLRDRPEDVELLATSFFRAATGNEASELPADVLALLRSYPWPGNVRELKNVVQRYAYLGFSDGELFDEAPSSRPAAFAAAPAAPADAARGAGVTPGAALLDLPYHEARRRLIEDFEAVYVPHVLGRARGVVSKAAELARIARPTFYRLVERFESRTARSAGTEVDDAPAVGDSRGNAR